MTLCPAIGGAIFFGYLIDIHFFIGISKFKGKVWINVLT